METLEQAGADEAPVSYPADAVLTVEQVAAWLRMSTRQVQRLPIKRCELGPRTCRYLAEYVYDFLRKKVA